MPSESVDNHQPVVEPVDLLADRFRQMLVLIRLMTREVTVVGRVQRMVEHSAALGRARYAAFALRNPDSSIESFVFSTTRPEELAALQQVLYSYGIAGAEHLPFASSNADHRPGGRQRPSNKQRQTDLLDIPVQTQFGLYGNLYVMGRRGGQPFDDEDRELLTHFAETTAVGVDGATQLEEAWQRQHWLLASGEISRRLLGGVEDERQIWRAIVDDIEFLASARTVTIQVPSEDDETQLQVQMAAGAGADQLVDRTFDRKGSLPELAITTSAVQIIMAGELPCIHTEVEEGVPLGHIVALPLRGMGSTRGAIVISRHADQPMYSASDVAMAEAFANQATLALELAEARSAQQTLEAREDRERIAESLQDQVIQRLFSIGLSLQSASDGTVGGRERVVRAISDIDETIRQVRASIDPLTSGRSTNVVPQLRAAVVAAVDEYEPLLGFRPDVHFSGPLDAAPESDIADDLAAVLGEALANIAQHSLATRARIDLLGTDDGVSLVIVDNGVNFAQRSSGLARLWERASVLGRTLNIEHPLEGGLRLRWFLPQPSTDPAP